MRLKYSDIYLQPRLCCLTTANLSKTLPIHKTAIQAANTTKRQTAPKETPFRDHLCMPHENFMLTFQTSYNKAPNH
jgi:hypothetical protein